MKTVNTVPEILTAFPDSHFDRRKWSAMKVPRTSSETGAIFADIRMWAIILDAAL